jgi:SNF2 family DNA or RNA helicase
MVKKADCLDLPPLVKVEVPVALGPIQQRLYKEMKEDFITYINDKACVAQLAITKALRLSQIVSGFIKTDDGVETLIDENPRLDALEELLELYAKDHKIIVWCAFRQNYKAVHGLCEKLKLGTASLTGDTVDREGEIKRFRADPLSRVLIGNPGAGGVGVNLIEASIAIYFSRTFSLEHDIQSEARNYRGGSECHEKITRFDLVAKGTIDELILTALRNKQDLAEKITNLKNLLA